MAVMAKAPGFADVKSRLQPPLTAGEARALATAFLLDRLDGVVALSGVVPLLAFTPPAAAPVLRALAPAGVGLLAQRGDGLGERLTCLFDDLLAEHRAALALDADSQLSLNQRSLSGIRVVTDADGVLETTLARARALGLRVHLLPRWFDVDTEADLKKLCDEIAVSGGPRRTAALAPTLAARLARAVVE
ncbi:MAG: hypothetical protein DME13_04710 [Candidatus Rokuibacteriota bacterium]|nr:MAG: hypothetical protein DME13_04710 [Candidatus Rokubacteria bacterium]